MPDTALSLLQDAFEKIKVYPPGVTINAADSSRGQSVMNQMLDQWSNQSYACFANLEQHFNLVVGKNSYTIGTSGGADIVQARPLEILKGPGRAYLMDANNNRYPIDVVEQDQWNELGLLTVTTDLPDTLFYDPQFPLGIINIFGTPSAVHPVYFESRLPLATLASLTTAFSVPPGYVQAIKDNVAIKLWPYYKQGDPTKSLVDEAADSLAVIKRTNIKRSPSLYDSAVVSKASSSYNIFSDSTNRGNG